MRRSQLDVYDHMKEKYEYCGYQLPNIIFWNVDSRNDIFHADSRRKGVQLYSGQSVTTFQNLLNNIDSTPVKSMEKVIERAVRMRQNWKCGIKMLKLAVWIESFQKM